MYMYVIQLGTLQVSFTSICPTVRYLIKYEKKKKKEKKDLKMQLQVYVVYFTTFGYSQSYFPPSRCVIYMYT